ESEVYAQLLFLRRKGYPMWRNSRLPGVHKQEGVQIGDVGILNDSGGFEYFFNVCHPADHPLNTGRVPGGFKPLLGINPDDIIDNAREYEPGSHVASNPHHILKRKIQVDTLEKTLNNYSHLRLRNVPEEVDAGLSFSSSATQGALLILPEGGQKVDHQQHSKFYNYTTEFARSWYRHINRPLAREIRNGSLYLVTGYDKARAWGVACFDDEDVCIIFMDIVPKVSSAVERAPKYWFSRCDGASSLSDADDVFENESGAVFLRGFKIAIRESWFLPKYSEVTYTSNMNVDSLLSEAYSAASWYPKLWKWLRLLFPETSNGPRDESNITVTSIPSKHQVSSEKTSDR
ncbi:hypothetical protein GYMLUDRAFT_179777, partial [Collybiopsis luxurians FD-317 M1]